jgi:hypothetical protein
VVFERSSSALLAPRPTTFFPVRPAQAVATPHNHAVIKVDLLLSVVTFALWVYCLVEVISTPEPRMRNLPKVGWVLIVLLFPLIGSIAWLVAGRPETTTAARSRHERPAPEFPEYDRPGRAAATDAAKDDDFLRQVRARAEEQRRRYEEQRRRQQQEPDTDG